MTTMNIVISLGREVKNMRLDLRSTEGNDIQLNLEKDSFINCHEFTMDFILSLYNSRLFIQKMNSQFIYEDMKTLYDDLYGVTGKGVKGICDMYIDLIKKGAETFEKTNMNEKIQSCSLILFAVSGKYCVAHSMIALNPNEWIGANNISSLGLNGSTDLSGGILAYGDMSERCYSNGDQSQGKQPQGGWLCREDAATKIEKYEMHYCMPNEKVDMYAIPLFDKRYPILFNLVSSAGGDGCCRIV